MWLNIGNYEVGAFGRMAVLEGRISGSGFFYRDLPP